VRGAPFYLEVIGHEFFQRSRKGLGRLLTERDHFATPTVCLRYAERGKRGHARGTRGVRQKAQGGQWSLLRQAQSRPDVSTALRTSQRGEKGQKMKWGGEPFRKHLPSEQRRHFLRSIFVGLRDLLSFSVTDVCELVCATSESCQVLGLSAKQQNGPTGTQRAQWDPRGGKLRSACGQAQAGLARCIAAREGSSWRNKRLLRENQASLSFLARAEMPLNDDYATTLGNNARLQVEERERRKGFFGADRLELEGKRPRRTSLSSLLCSEKGFCLPHLPHHFPANQAVDGRREDGNRSQLPTNSWRDE